MNAATAKLFNIVSERKGMKHPLHDFVNKTGIGMVFDQIEPIRESWMDENAWAEAQACYYWKVRLHRRTDNHLVQIIAQIHTGTARVWKNGASATAPENLRGCVIDFTRVAVSLNDDEYREFVSTWSEPDPPYPEEVIETLAYDAKHVEDNLTRRDFRKRFQGQSEEVCDSAWRECVNCRRQLRRIFRKSEYHTLMAFIYERERQ